MTQIAVWRGGLGYKDHTARSVFWNHLFPIHATVASDRKQTWFGSKFWEDCVRGAFERGVHVCFANVMTGEIKQIATPANFDTFRGQIYGDTDRFESLRIIISAQPIQGKGELRLRQPEVAP